MSLDEKAREGFDGNATLAVPKQYRLALPPVISQTEMEDTAFYKMHTNALHHADRLQFLVKSIYDEKERMMDYMRSFEETDQQTNELIFGVWNRISAIELSDCFGRMKDASHSFYKTMSQIAFHPGSTTDKAYSVSQTLENFTHNIANPFFGIAGHANNMMKTVNDYCNGSNNKLCDYLSERASSIVSMCKEVDLIKQDIMRTSRRAQKYSGYNFPKQ